MDTLTPPRATNPDSPTPPGDDLTSRVRSLRLSNQVTAKTSSSRLAWVLVVLLACATGYLGYREVVRGPGTTPEMPAGSAANAASNTAQAASTGNKPAATPQEVPEDGELALQVRGYIIPSHQILVSPKVSGMVTKLFIEEGQRVRKGQVLAEMEQVEYLSDLQRVQAQFRLSDARYRLLLAGTREEEVRQVQAELAESETQAKQAKADHERNIALRKEDRTLVPDALFEETDTLSRAAEQRLQGLQARLDQAVKGAREQELEAALAESQQYKADVVKAQWRLDNCTIIAPISGTVLKKNAEEGNIVNPIAFNGSFSLCDLADLADLEVDLDVDERDISKVYPGQACRIITPAYPERVYQGYVDRLLPIADRAQAAVPVRVKVQVPKEEEGLFLKPEMSANVTFLRKKFDQPITKPAATDTPAPPVTP